MTAPEPALTFVDRYISAVGNGDLDAVSDLFAADADFFHPQGVAFGRAAIVAFYAVVFARGGLAARPGPAFADGREVLFEIFLRDGPDGDGPFAMDHVTLDEWGRAVRLVAMVRPGATLPATLVD